MKSKTPAEDAFDCVAFKHQTQENIYKKIKGLTPEQEIAYFEQRAESGNLGHWWKRVKSSAASVLAHHPRPPRKHNRKGGTR
ncbi:MAG: hypothetical protein ABSH20_17995 [Tepidisphaeraceae bacterium]|jgi:hypothetical protein